MLETYRQLLRDSSELKRLAKQSLNPSQYAAQRAQVARRLRNLNKQLDPDVATEAQRVQAMIDVQTYAALGGGKIDSIISNGGAAVKYIEAHKGKALSALVVTTLAVAYINTGDDGIPDTLAAQNTPESQKALKDLKDVLKGTEEVDMGGQEDWEDRLAAGPDMGMETPPDATPEEPEDAEAEAGATAADTDAPVDDRIVDAASAEDKDVEDVKEDLKEKQASILFDANIGGTYKLEQLPERALRLFIIGLIKGFDEEYSKSVPDPEARKSLIRDILRLNDEKIDKMQIKSRRIKEAICSQKILNEKEMSFSAKDVADHEEKSWMDDRLAAAKKSSKNKKFNNQGMTIRNPSKYELNRGLFIKSIMGSLEFMLKGDWAVKDPRWSKIEKLPNYSEKTKVKYERQLYKKIQKVIKKAYNDVMNYGPVKKQMKELEDEAKRGTGMTGFGKLDYLDKYDFSSKGN
jgi:hypothetical protein